MFSEFNQPLLLICRMRFVSHRIPSGFIMDFLNLLRRILVTLSISYIKVDYLNVTQTQ